MLKKISNIVLVLLFASILGCKDNSIEIPKHIMPQDSAIMLFAELQIMEALVIQGSINPQDSVLKLDHYRLGLLNQFGLSMERFEESYNFYLSHPELFDKVLTGVMEELSKRKAKTEGVQEPKPIQADSVKLP